MEYVKKRRETNLVLAIAVLAPLLAIVIIPKLIHYSVVPPEEIIKLENE